MIYRTGPFTWSATHPGVLQLTPDDRLRLYLIHDGEARPEPEFDVATSEVRRIGGALSYLTVYLAQKTYRLELGPEPDRPRATSGGELWASRLKDAGVSVRYLNGARFVALTLGITAAIIVLSVALVLAVG